MEGSWNRDVLDIREIQFLVPLPSKETFDIKEIKIISIAFRAYSEEKLSLTRAKIFCSENILKNLINLNSRWPLTSEVISVIDNFIHYELLPYLKRKYPVAEWSSNQNLKEILKQVDLKNLAGSNYIQGSTIKWKYRQSGIYNDLIMKTLNHVLSKIDHSSQFTFDNKGSHYQDFKFMMNSIFQQVEDYDYMVLQNGKLQETILLVYRLILKLAGIEEEMVLPREVEYKPWDGDSLQDILHKRDSYKAKVKEYTSYSVSRKVPEGIELYTDKEIQSMNITFKSPAILRIIQKWCKELILKFDKPNYFQKQSISSYERGSDLNSLLREDRIALDKLMAEQKKEMDIFMQKINKNNYHMQELLLRKDRKDYHQQGHQFIDELEWKTGILSLDLIKHFNNYLVSYINRLIHGLLNVSRQFYNQQRIAHIQWSSPPNLITFTIADLMRCKFRSKQKEIIQVIKNFQQLNSVHSQNRISFLQIKNRLELDTHDISLIFKFNNDIICEVQLTIETNKHNKPATVENQFPHYLYELERSTFGPLVQICNIWVNIDSRFEVYEKLRKRNSVIEWPNKSFLIECSRHSTIFVTDPFICSLCQQAYSHNYFIREHKKCLNCNQFYCSKCSIAWEIEENPNKLLQIYVPDKQIRDSCCSDLYTLAKYRDSLKTPDLGVCIEIESKIAKAQIFHIFEYQDQRYLLGKNEGGIYEIEKVNTEQQMQNFLTRYLVFGANNKGSERLKNIDQKTAIKEYILPSILLKNFKEYDYKITISEGLEDESLTSIFESIQFFNRRSVRQILLDNNQIQTAATVTSYFPNIEFLELSRNQITNYNHLQSLEHLKHLQLSHCRLTEIPSNIYLISTIERLKVSYNRISAIQAEVGQLKQLRVLEINNNNLKTLPRELELCTELIILRGDNNKFQNEIRLDLSKFLHLKQLDIGYNEISISPPICRLQNLQLLKMNRNELKTIESDIGKLSNLVEFDLEYNKLNDLTKIKFQGLKKLKKMILSFNPELDKLPQDLKSCSSLEELYLQSCCFETVPVETSIPSMKILVMKSNRIKNVGYWLQEQKNLEYLDLSSNQFSNDFQKDLIYSFKEMKELREINLSNSNCISMPTFSSCNKLQIIKVGFNKINEINKELEGLNHLTYLDASNNHIEKIDGSITTLSSLIELDLHCNEVREIKPVSEEYQKFPSLQNLNLSYNKLRTLPQVITESQKLRVLYLQKNNDLRNLPQRFVNLKNLQELDISDTSIKDIKQFMKKMPLLKLRQTIPRFHTNRDTRTSRDQSSFNRVLRGS